MRRVRHGPTAPNMKAGIQYSQWLPTHYDFLPTFNAIYQGFWNGPLGSPWGPRSGSLGAASRSIHSAALLWYCITQVSWYIESLLKGATAHENLRTTAIYRICLPQEKTHYRPLWHHMKTVWHLNQDTEENSRIYYKQVFLRRFRETIRVPRISFQVGSPKSEKIGSLESEKSGTYRFKPGSYHFP